MRSVRRQTYDYLNSFGASPSSHCLVPNYPAWQQRLICNQSVRYYRDRSIQECRSVWSAEIVTSEGLFAGEGKVCVSAYHGISMATLLRAW